MTKEKNEITSITSMGKRRFGESGFDSDAGEMGPLIPAAEEWVKHPVGELSGLGIG